MAYCKRCNRSLEKGEKKSDHVCDMVVLKKKGMDEDAPGAVVTIHADALKEGGSHVDRVGKDGDLEVIYRYRQPVVERVKSAAEKLTKKPGKKDKRTESGLILPG